MDKTIFPARAPAFITREKNAVWGLRTPDCRHGGSGHGFLLRSQTHFNLCLCECLRSLGGLVE